MTELKNYKVCLRYKNITDVLDYVKDQVIKGRMLNIRIDERTADIEFLNVHVPQEVKSIDLLNL